jgi:hypothetical protein
MRDNGGRFIPHPHSVTLFRYSPARGTKKSARFGRVADAERDRRSRSLELAEGEFGPGSVPYCGLGHAIPFRVPVQQRVVCAVGVAPAARVQLLEPPAAPDIDAAIVVRRKENRLAGLPIAALYL